MTDLCRSASQQVIDSFQLTTETVWVLEKDVLGDSWEWLSGEENGSLRDAIEDHVSELVNGMDTHQIVTWLLSSDYDVVKVVGEPSFILSDKETSWKDVIASLLVTTINYLLQEMVPQPESV